MITKVDLTLITGLLLQIKSAKNGAFYTGKSISAGQAIRVCWLQSDFRPLRYDNLPRAVLEFFPIEA